MARRAVQSSQRDDSALAGVQFLASACARIEAASPSSFPQQPFFQQGKCRLQLEKPQLQLTKLQLQTGEGVWQNLGIFPQARRIELTNLTPGTVYSVQVRGMGGSKYYSDWSDPSSHMAT